MLPTWLLPFALALTPATLRGAPETAALSRRAALSSATAILVAAQSSRASAAGLDNLAEEKLAAILSKKVAEREATFGFKLDAEDIKEIENVLRNKYCGPQGAFSGEPGGTCAPSPQAEATCFRATGKAESCVKSYDK